MENETKHTPGPWEALEQRGGKTVKIMRRHWQVGNTTTRGGVALAFGDDAGNAHLLAAAPDLLAYAKCEEAIWSNNKPKDSIAVLTLHGYDEKKHRCPGDFLDEFRKAAIAKATGASA